MNKTRPRRSEFIRLRLTPEERRIIQEINFAEFSNISEHVRRSLLFYANMNYPNLIKNNRITTE
jgi:hypothetical protein